MPQLFILALIIVFLPFLAHGLEFKGDIQSPDVQRACERLSERLGDVEGRIRLAQEAGTDERLGDEGYAIRSGRKGIVIKANTHAGLANGVYTLLRTIMIEDIDDPFSKQWDVHETPALRWRSMMVAPYPFGGAQGASVFSPDQWDLQEWKQYLDYLRLFNLNAVGLYPMRWYDPNIPKTWPNNTRYEIWKQAMDYAHELGMTFTFVMTANGVPQEVWWQNPDLRTKHDTVWSGCALCYSAGRDIVRKTQQYTFDYFKDADYFMLMFSDGGGACYCDRCSEDQAAVFMQMTRDTQTALSEAGSDAKIIFWNWWLNGWYQMEPKIPGFHEQFPQLEGIQDNVFERLPRDIVFEDVGLVPQIWGARRDTLVEAKQKGFETVVDFAYFMNPEIAAFIFPRPLIEKTLAMARYARDNELDGIDGYRLAPLGRILNDFAFMRAVWNPDLTQDELIDEMAGFLTEKPENRKRVAAAVKALSAFREADVSDESHEKIARASKLLNEAKQDEPSYQLEYIADMTYMLNLIHKQLLPNLSPEEVAAIRNEAFEATFERYILQGFGGTDNVWQPESRRQFEAFMTIWLQSHAAFAIPLQEESNAD